MSPPSSPALLARLRASTRLIALVLAVFLLKVGLVAACASHDFNDTAVTTAEQASAKTQLQLDSGDNEEPAEPNESSGCIDCHCHQVATMAADITPRLSVVPAAEPPDVSVSVRTVSPGQELRPPIV